MISTPHEKSTTSGALHCTGSCRIPSGPEILVSRTVCTCKYTQQTAEKNLRRAWKKSTEYVQGGNMWKTGGKVYFCPGNFQEKRAAANEAPRVLYCCGMFVGPSTHFQSDGRIMSVRARCYSSWKGCRSLEGVLELRLTRAILSFRVRLCACTEGCLGACH